MCGSLVDHELNVVFNQALVFHLVMNADSRS
jgi:hypothetical protein